LKPHLKAVVFRTPRLKETMSYFTDQLGLSIKEYSPTHFVIFSKGIRVVFIESETDPNVELYFSKSIGESFAVLEDPNQIKIIIS
jgi:hypothetical protein